MAKNKTIETKASVADYIKKITDEKKRKDFADIVSLFKKQTGLDPKMWGSSIIGFGSYHYVYDSGREGDAPLTGLSNRSNAVALYLSANFEKREELLTKLGKHQAAKGCVYIQKLTDIDTGVLSKMIKNSVTHIKKLYPDNNEADMK